MLTAGPLSGLRIEIPPGALTQPTVITVSDEFASATPGFRALQRAAAIEPADLQFALPVRVTLPFDASGQSSNEIVPLARFANGRMHECAPVTVGDGALTFEVTQFPRLWAAERLFGGFTTLAHLPTEDGNFWTLDNGTTVHMTFSSTEPNLEGLDVYRLGFETSVETNQPSFGLYLMVAESGALLLRGTFVATASESYQILHEAVPFFPAALTIGLPMVAVHTFDEARPLGGVGTMSAGIARSELLADFPEKVVTPMGTFTDVFRLHWRTNLVWERGGETERNIAFTFARRIGPVAVDDGISAGRLSRGAVGGRPIRRPS